jgi:hypothetical protein
MATEKQIAANRRNSQKSTGPRSAKGKAASRFNALKTGIYAEMETLPCENPDEYRILAADFHMQFQPSTPADCSLVDILVNAEWQMRRYRRMEAQLFETAIDRMIVNEKFSSGNNPSDAYSYDLEAFSRLHRRLQSLERSFRQTLEILERRESHAPESAESIEVTPVELPAAPPIGFVPPEIVAQPLRLPRPGSWGPTRARRPIGFVPSNLPPGETASRPRAHARNPR